MVYTYFKADKGTIDALAPQGENSCEGAGGGGNCRRASPGDVAVRLP